MADDSSPEIHPKSKPLTAERLRLLLDYDPATGILKWRKNGRRKNSHEGQPAGAINASGGLVVRVDYRMHHAARLAWLHYYGEWPKGFVDHRNRNRADNRIENLREATPGENSRNQGRARNNTSGFKGVNYVKPTGKWRAVIRAHGKMHFLGGFVTKGEAAQAYRDAAVRR